MILLSYCQINSVILPPAVIRVIVALAVPILWGLLVELIIHWYLKSRGEKA